MTKKFNFKQAATISAGVVASGFGSAIIQKALPGQGFIKGAYGNAAIQVALGVLTPSLIKGQTGKDLGTGMAVGGLVTVLAGLISPSAAGLSRYTGSTYIPGVGAYKNAEKKEVNLKMN